VYQQNIDKINAMEASHEISAGTAAYFRDRVNELAGSIGRLPTSHNTDVTADTSQAEEALRRFRDSIGVTNTQLNGTYGRGLGIMVPGHAIGGPIQAGQTSPAAEQGIELFRGSSGAMSLLRGPTFTAPESGMIYTAGQTRQMMAGGGLQLTIPVDARGSDLSEAQITDAVIRAVPVLMKAMRAEDRARA
jgi:hypothetical protein